LHHSAKQSNVLHYAWVKTGIFYIKGV